MADENTIDYVIGLPPDDMVPDTNTVIKNSMPLARIYPGIPSFTKGLNLFTRKGSFVSNSRGKQSPSYYGLLRQHGYSLSQPGGQLGEDGCIVVAYQADSFPTDSFTNEYGENFLQKMTETVSQGAAELSQMFGGRDLGEVYSGVQKALEGGGAIESMIGAGLDVGAGIGNAAKKVFSSLPMGKGIHSAANLASSLAAGGRIDFPLMWKTSGFAPSYTMTVRLYNPYPGSKAATQKYIAAPLAALMLLGIPISRDGSTYSWPFIHRIWSPGIYDLDPAYISNITVIKGGDQQQISYKQRLGLVDVRIDFGSLYSTIIAGKGMSTRTRPTLENYINAIAGADSEKSGIKNFSTYPDEGGKAEQVLYRRLLPGERAPVSETRNQAPTTIEPSQEEIQSPPGRVSDSDQTTSNNLQSRMPIGL